MITEIKQQHYGTLQIDTSESDIVQIWNAGELIQIDSVYVYGDDDKLIRKAKPTKELFEEIMNTKINITPKKK